MPKKLVLDRTIRLMLNGASNQEATVPSGEAWRVTVAGRGVVNGIEIESQNIVKTHTFILGEGSTLYGSYNNSTRASGTLSVTGLAFKLQEV